MLSFRNSLRSNGSRRVPFLVATSITLASLTSCNSGPARVKQAYIDANEAGSAAMDEYDSNGDGVVAGDELEKAPGLKAMLATTDTNKDGGISADELSARIQAWQAMKVGVTTFGFTAILNGKPLEGAIVTFEPESFLGNEVKPAVATTDLFGSGGPTIPKDQRPDPNTSPPGVSLGIYKVKISKLDNGKEMIPPIYNEQTTLGVEVAPDVSEILNRRLRFVLKSN